MPNPRYLSYEGEPTVELLMKLYNAKKVYFNNLDSFCKKMCFDRDNFYDIKRVYLIGSHAEEDKWHNDTSDIDFKLVLPNMIPQNLFEYKRRILDNKLCSSERKRDWIDLYFVKEDYQVDGPRWDVTRAWKDIKKLIH
jgi:hypothetical protein